MTSATEPADIFTTPDQPDAPGRSVSVWMHDDQTGTFFDCPVCHFWKNNDVGPCRSIGCSGIVEKVTVRVDTAESDPDSDEDTLRRLGFEKRYRLCGHPAYPDPLNIWPPTEQNAARIYSEYCSDTFEEYVAKLGFTPRRFGGTPMTAADFNPRILITWEYTGERQVFVPSSNSNAPTGGDRHGDLDV